MPAIAIVYHSGFGHTKAVAEHVHRGVDAVDGCTASLISVDEFPAPGPDRKLGGRWAELDAADAIILGCPTYMGGVSAAMKQFMESSSGLWMKQAWKDKIAAGFTNSGGLSGDKVNALVGMAVFAAQQSMIWVSQGIFYNEQGINRMGAWLGLMTQSDNAPPDQTPPKEDRDTAELFGRRVAEATIRWVRGAG